MNAFNRSALKAYGHVQTDVAAEYADSHSLVSMLFNGAIDNLCKAEYNFETGNIAARGEAITKAQKILFDSGRRRSRLGRAGQTARFTLRLLYTSLTQAHARASRPRYRKSKG